MDNMTRLSIPINPIRRVNLPSFANYDFKLIRVVSFYIILSVLNGLIVRYVFKDLPSTIDVRIVAIVINLVQNSTGCLFFFPLSDSVISNKELMFKHWPLTVGSGVLFGVRKILTNAVSGTLSVGADYMTGILLSLGAVVFDHLVLQKPFSSRWQWLYVVLSVAGCVSFGAELIKSIDNVFWVGFGFGCASKMVVLLNFLWMQYFMIKKDERLDNYSVMFAQTYVGVILSGLITLLSGSFHIVFDLFATTRISILMVALVVVNIFATINYFGIVDQAKSSVVCNISTEVAKGFYAIIGIFIFSPMPGALGWSGLCMSLVGSYIFAAFCKHKKPQHRESTVVPVDQDEVSCIRAYYICFVL